MRSEQEIKDVMEAMKFMYHKHGKDVFMGIQADVLAWVLETEAMVCDLGGHLNVAVDAMNEVKAKQASRNN